MNTTELNHESVFFPQELVANHHTFSSFPEPSSVAAHWHRSLEISYWHDCTGTLTIGKNDIQIHPGDTILINSGDLHSLSTPKLEHGYVFLLLIKYEFLKALLPDYDTYHFILPRQNTIIRDLMLKIQQLSSEKSKDPFFHVEFNGLCNQLIYQLLKHCMIPRQDNIRFKTSQYPEKMISILNYIQEHLSEIQTTNDVCDRFYYSSVHFSRLFTQYLGCTFHDYLINLKTEEVKRQVIFTDKTMNEIA